MKPGISDRVKRFQEETYATRAAAAPHRTCRPFSRLLAATAPPSPQHPLAARAVAHPYDHRRGGLHEHRPLFHAVEPDPLVLREHRGFLRLDLRDRAQQEQL